MSQARTLERIPLGIAPSTRRLDRDDDDEDEAELELASRAPEGIMIGLPPRELVEEFRASTGEVVRIWRERGVHPPRPNRR